MLAIIAGTTLAGAGLVVLLIVFRPEAWRAYFYRSRHSQRAAARREALRNDPHHLNEEWFREWRKQFPALMEETREMSVLRDR